MQFVGQVVFKTSHLRMLCFGIHLDYKSVVCLLIATIILKHYFLGSMYDLRFTYEVYQAYVRKANDSFHDDGDKWINERLFSDYVDENVTAKTEGVVNLPVHDSWTNTTCKPILKSQFRPIADNAQKVLFGGVWQPSHCKYLNSVALIVPYRWREKHLKYFIPYMHLFLQNQLLKYQIFLVEQNGITTFNRGKLMNVGFTEALKWETFDCYIFHDVDLFPLNGTLFYNCSTEGPLHMAVGIDKFGHRLPYSVYFGGVTAFTEKQYKQTNGFSNNYYGWGGEDDALGFRVKLSGQKLVRLPEKLGMYKMMKHNRDKGNEENVIQRLRLLGKTYEEWKSDGLNSLNYYLVSYEMKPLYTRILVDV